MRRRGGALVRQGDGRNEYVERPSASLDVDSRDPSRQGIAQLHREVVRRADLARILVEPEASLKKQYVALLGTEGVTLDLTDEAIEEIATLAYDINGRVENIGARRLQTVMEKLVEEISFNASDRGGEAIRIDKAYVRDKVGSLVQGADLSRFIL